MSATTFPPAAPSIPRGPMASRIWTLSTMLKKELNMSYLEIRHQYVTYLHLHSDLEHAKNGAQNMGHSLSMAISTYNDLSIDEED